MSNRRCPHGFLSDVAAVGCVMCAGRHAVLPGPHGRERSVIRAHNRVATAKCDRCKRRDPKDKMQQHGSEKARRWVHVAECREEID